jgi:hypothetical protein
LEGKVLRLGIGQTIAAVNVIEHSHGNPPPESHDGKQWLSADEVRLKVILPSSRNPVKLKKPG